MEISVSDWKLPFLGNGNGKLKVRAIGEFGGIGFLLFCEHDIER